MSKYLRFTLIENGAVHTTGLKLQDAEEMLARHQATFPDIEWWNEQDYLRTTFRDENGNI